MKAYYRILYYNTHEYKSLQLEAEDSELIPTLSKIYERGNIITKVEKIPEHRYNTYQKLRKTGEF